MHSMFELVWLLGSLYPTIVITCFSFCMNAVVLIQLSIYVMLLSSRLFSKYVNLCQTPSTVQNWELTLLSLGEQQEQEKQ